MNETIRNLRARFPEVSRLTTWRPAGKTWVAQATVNGRGLVACGCDAGAALLALRAKLEARRETRTPERYECPVCGGDCSGECTSTAPGNWNW